MRIKTFLIAAFVATFSTLVLAGPLTEARVTKIVNEVKLVDPAAGDRDAKLDDVVRDQIALTTGIKSRSELVFQDNTLTRLGPESYFSFKGGTREMNLQKGTLLLQVPKGLGGAKIHTASVTAAITGTTIMMEYVPNRDIKVLVLEGTLRLSMNGRFGDSLLLTPGKMVIMPPNARRIPDPVTVDLKKVVQTSTLVNMHSKKGKQTGTDQSSLPSISKIEKEVNQQGTGKDSHKLVDTNLIILGKGTNVVVGSDELIADLGARTNVEKTQHIPVKPPPPPKPGPTPIPAPTPNSNPPPTGTPAPPPPGIYTVDNTTTIDTPNSAAPTIVTQGLTTSGVIYTSLSTNGSPAGFLFGAASAFDNKLNFDNTFLTGDGGFQNSAVFTFDSLKLTGGIVFTNDGGPNDVVLVGDNGITNGAGSFDLGGINAIMFATKSGTITLDATISFSTSVNEQPKVVQFYARSGDINSAATFSLTSSDLQFEAENNANFSAGTITSKSLEVTGLLAVNFDANANVESLFQLDGGAVELGGSVTAGTAYIYGSSATINGTLNAAHVTANVTGDFVENNGSTFDVPPGAPGDAFTSITAGGNVTLDGTVKANKLSISAGNALTIDGPVTTSDAFNTTAASAAINGTLNVKQATFQTTGNFILGLSGSLKTTGGDVQINATAGGITVDGIINSAHNLLLTASGAIVIDHSMTAANQISITGKSIAFNTDFSGPGSGPNATELTATSGDINAAGHTLSGFDQILLNSGNFTVGTLTSTKTVSVAGTLAGNSITADTITANALQVDSLTANKTLTVNTANLAPYATNTITINAPTLNLLAGANLNGTNGTPSLTPGNASNLAITTGSYTVASNFNLNGGDADSSTNDLGGNGGQFDLTSNAGGGGLTVNAPISATTGLNSKNGQDGGNGGTVNLNSTNTITLNNKIEVSSNGASNPRRRSASGGHINVKSTATGGTAINVSSSAQLLALLNAAAPGPGGSIKFSSAGGAINMSGTVQADRGTIEITNNGTNGGQINLTNATLMADTIKVGALAPNGTLNIGGGTISADTMLKLYAGGSNGTIDFTDNVTLSGNSAKIIAANTVIINNGKIVTILGPSAADVFTNNAKYTGFGGNASTTGTFAGKGAVTHPLSGAPSY
ncbi:MAG TPA: FecR domain-containing protein [Chthoniobacterales bacterium]|nr:FecR domain-containing protein [Chthoniobacterales bacterium]